MNGNSRVLATTIPGSSKAFIDSSVMNLALPAIQAGFRASVPALRWVASGDLLSLGALVLLGGSRGPVRARAGVFMAGVAGPLAIASAGLRGPLAPL